MFPLYARTDPERSGTCFVLNVFSWKLTGVQEMQHVAGLYLLCLNQIIYKYTGFSSHLHWQIMYQDLDVNENQVWDCPNSAKHLSECLMQVCVWSNRLQINHALTYFTEQKPVFDKDIHISFTVFC